MLIGTPLPASVNAARSGIGNRANGFSYQPTQGEVDTREQAIGLQQSPSRAAKTDRDLQHLDRALLSQEGLSTSSVP